MVGSPGPIRPRLYRPTPSPPLHTRHLCTPTPTPHPCRAEQQFEVIVRKNKDGVEEEGKEVLYGGTRDGKPVGGARFYLGPEFIGQGCVGGQFISMQYHCM